MRPVYSEMIQKDENAVVHNSLIVGDSFSEAKSCNGDEFIENDNNDNNSDSLCESSSDELSTSSSDYQSGDGDSNDVRYSVTAGNSPLSVVIKRCNNLAAVSEDSRSNNSEMIFFKSSPSSTIEIQPNDNIERSNPEHLVEEDKDLNSTESINQVEHKSLNDSISRNPCSVEEYVDTIRSLVEMGLGVSESDEIVGSQVSGDGSKSLVEILLGSQLIIAEKSVTEPKDVLKNEENISDCTTSLSVLHTTQEDELDILNLDEAKSEVVKSKSSSSRLTLDDERKEPTIILPMLPSDKILSNTSEGSYAVLSGSEIHSAELQVQARSSDLGTETKSVYCKDLNSHLQTFYLQSETGKLLHLEASNVQLEMSELHSETSSLHHEISDSQLETSSSFAEKSVIASGVDQIIYSPPMFSDDEDDAENSLYYGPGADKVSPSDICRRSRTTEGRRLKQLQLSMVGLPPPPAVTNPQLSVNDILQSLKENETAMSWSVVTAEKRDLQAKYLEQAKECAWPDSAFFCYPDIYYNNGLGSEQFASLSQKFVQRYVGAETACICNVAGSTGSARKRNRKLGAGLSPGRRLSHLARRRKAFSRDNLLSTNAGSLPNSQPNALPERRQIVVAARTKFDVNRHVTSTASLNINIIQSAGSLVLSHKRALFQSPDENKKKTSAKKSQSGSKKKNNFTKTGIQSFKRALFGSASKDKELPDVKRSRSEAHPVSISSKRKLLFDNVEDAGSKSLGPAVSSSSKKNYSGAKNHPGSSSSMKSSTKSALMNSAHKKKLLWAVAESLRKKGVNMSHALFRPCASSLARICRSLLPDLQRHNGSTSELMLEIADKYATDIIREKQAEADSL